MSSLKINKRDFARMHQLLVRDHGGCDEAGCALAAFLDGEDDAVSDIEVLNLWYHTGASDTEFDRLYKRNEKAIKRELETENE